MQTYIECVGCLARQAVDIACQNIPPQRQESFIKDILIRLSRFDYTSPPPIMAMEMYDMLREIEGIEDPFAHVKSVYNEMALQLYPDLKEIVKVSDDPVETALRIAVAGNIIDFGARNAENIHIEDTLKRALEIPFSVDHTSQFKKQIEDSRSIVYLADNAGEIVFDRVLIEEIGPERVTCAVRDLPVINDATLKDTSQTGLDDVCSVVSSGSRAPGTPLYLCSDEFKEMFYSADVVISKGQGNFETLNHVDRDVFFLFMIKCPIISREVGAALNSFIIMRHP